MPAKNQQDFEMRQGDFRNLDFTIKDKDGTVVNVTGFTGEWMLARSREDTSPLLTKSPSVEDGVNGIMRVTMDPSDTLSPSALRGEFYQELELSNPSGNPSVVAEGIITIKGAITR